MSWFGRGGGGGKESENDSMAPEKTDMMVGDASFARCTLRDLYEKESDRECFTSRARAFGRRAVHYSQRNHPSCVTKNGLFEEVQLRILFSRARRSAGYASQSQPSRNYAPSGPSGGGAAPTQQQQAMLEQAILEQQQRALVQQVMGSVVKTNIFRSREPPLNKVCHDLTKPSFAAGIHTDATIASRPLHVFFCSIHNLR